MTVASISCQHCGSEATAERTMCPACRRRMRPGDASTIAPVGADTLHSASVPQHAVPVEAPAPGPLAAPPGFGRALLMSVGIALAGIAAWVVLAEAIQVRTALIAFGVAAGVAAVMRQFAPDDRRAPATIVILTIVSAILGLLASQYVLLADAVHMNVMTVVSRVPVSKIPRLMTTGTSAITWVIIAVSAYSGFGYAQRHSAARRAATATAGSTPQS